MTDIDRLREALEALLGRHISRDEPLDKTADSINEYVAQREQNKANNKAWDEYNND
jgi:hypothetical protein